MFASPLSTQRLNRPLSIILGSELKGFPVDGWAKIKSALSDFLERARRRSRMRTNTPTSRNTTTPPIDPPMTAALDDEDGSSRLGMLSAVGIPVATSLAVRIRVVVNVTGTLTVKPSSAMDGTTLAISSVNVCISGSSVEPTLMANRVGVANTRWVSDDARTEETGSSASALLTATGVEGALAVGSGTTGLELVSGFGSGTSRGIPVDDATGSVGISGGSLAGGEGNGTLGGRDGDVVVLVSGRSDSGGLDEGVTVGVWLLLGT